MSKKVQERIYLDWFVEQIGWSCEITGEYDESPDFVVRLNGENIGVELTNIYALEDDRKGSIVKSEESYRNKFLRRLAKKYYELSNVPIHLQALQLFGTLPASVDEIVHSLSSEKLEVEEWCEIEYKNNINSALKFRFRRLPEEFEQYSRWNFVDNYVGFSRAFEIGLLESRINSKSNRLKDYKKKCNGVVLLVVCDRTVNSGRFHLPVLLNSNLDFSTISLQGFDSVYLALYPEKVIEIG